MISFFLQSIFFFLVFFYLSDIIDLLFGLSGYKKKPKELTLYPDFVL